MELLIIKLLEYLRENKEHNSSASIAKIMINNLEKISKMSLEEAAQFCHCSPSTLNRLIKKIGFDNFKQLRKIITLPKLVYPTDGFNNEEYKKNVLLNIEETSDLNINNVVQRIRNSDRIIILSFATNYPFVTEFQVKMALKHKYVETLFDQNAEQALEALDRNDLVIIISDQGNFLMNMNLDSYKFQKLLLTQTIPENINVFDEVIKIGTYSYYGESKYGLMYFLDRVYEEY
ncbi:MurR/RpiR family transcriptional regulator [Companilactobacillus bobalius]|uniref:HTH rpiR-type domain-containing protein n=2 Tax=Companilactobacillus bobalius TaxID=2801451 RepID=A0A202FFC6_9LACO|nr:MurR/RpiR family transcriptional regulator [Companilactobacillus bobalius]KAE9560410.1 hypothetical protein ATN92_09610 [Companilactobacillus bobalius]KRK83161.1 hypothetical protein FC78_GL001970 [Companilactobacillus bobalius DSM 19674]OVE99150.1 hypothetical protein LKACC16343_00262 [Companilactobacillus bobalius]GEO57126.1 hypothetical protein LBO01_02550 [Companilactobacillus paralimentarius]